MPLWGGGGGNQVYSEKHCLFLPMLIDGVMANAFLLLRKSLGCPVLPSLPPPPVVAYEGGKLVFSNLPIPCEPENVHFVLHLK